MTTPPPAAEVPYAALSPDAVLDAVEAAGFVTDGRVLALGSYENRVYQVGLEDGAPLVAKFYRPGRWPTAAIEEEHAFALELAGAEIPVVAPLVIGGQTLFQAGPYPVALYPRRGGRWPELSTAADRELMGRFLGRLHRLGSVRPFEHRPALTVERLVVEPAQFIHGGDWLPSYVRDRYEAAVETIAEAADNAFAAIAPRRVRLHGDCHRNNVLWTDSGPHFVDLDDCVSGPAVQDLWMLLAGSAAEMRAQLVDYLTGYEQFMPFDRAELGLIEPLRAMRMVHYTGWLARRWHDPAFPQAFPWFGTPVYFESHVHDLERAIEAIEAAPFAAAD